jgi:glycosyltransferase involved in cell wall biosynthesis
VEFVGEISDADKSGLLGGALALLFPIDWPEPFGLVMIEALACGTPVIAYRRGSVPEIIDDGITGFVVEDEEDALAAIGRIGEIDRARCRETFLARFSAGRMARDYVDVYRAVRERQSVRLRTRGAMVERPAGATDVGPFVAAGTHALPAKRAS